MIVRVYELMEDKRLEVIEFHGETANPVKQDSAFYSRSLLFPADEKDKRVVRLMCQSDSYSVDVRKIDTPSYQTTLQLREQEDGSIAIRILGIEVHIIPDSLPEVVRALTAVGVES